MRMEELRRRLISSILIFSSSHSQGRRLQVFNERLTIKPLAGGFVKRISKGSHHRWKGRFTQTCWINFILHKVYVDGFWCFAMAYQTILVEVALIGGSLGERQATVHGMPYAVNTSPLNEIGRRQWIH